MVLRWLATQWLRESATNLARETMAQQMAADAAPDEDHDADAEPCHAAILFALSIEAAGLIERLQTPRQLRGEGLTAHVGRLGTHRVAVATTGPGETQAARAARAVIAGHHPRWVIACGFAGGLQAEISREDLIVADRLLHAGQPTIAIPLAMPARAGLHVGPLLTIDHIAHTAEEKQRLGQETGALAVDMETFAVAGACREAKLRMMAVRVISDAADDELPKDIEHLMNQTSHVGRAGAATGAIFRRPSSVKDMWNLHERAIRCSDRLAEFLVGLIAQLPK